MLHAERMLGTQVKMIFVHVNSTMIDELTSEKEKLNRNVGNLHIPSISPHPQRFSTMNLFKQWHGFFLL